jgi:branched-subunit amino acid transport protein
MLIGMMTLVTFIPRYLPFALAGKVQLPGMLKRALDFVPIAVLTAIVAQSALIRDGELDFSIANHHVLAALSAFVVALITRHLFLTIGAGLGSFVMLRLLSG